MATIRDFIARYEDRSQNVQIYGLDKSGELKEIYFTGTADKVPEWLHDETVIDSFGYRAWDNLQIDWLKEKNFPLICYKETHSRKQGIRKWYYSDVYVPETINPEIIQTIIKNNDGVSKHLKNLNEPSFYRCVSKLLKIAKVIDAIYNNEDFTFINFIIYPYDNDPIHCIKPEEYNFNQIFLNDAVETVEITIQGEDNAEVSININVLDNLAKFTEYPTSSLYFYEDIQFNYMPEFERHAKDVEIALREIIDDNKQSNKINSRLRLITGYINNIEKAEELLAGAEGDAKEAAKLLSDTRKMMTATLDKLAEDLNIEL